MINNTPAGTNKVSAADAGGVAAAETAPTGVSPGLSTPSMVEDISGLDKCVQVQATAARLKRASLAFQAGISRLAVPNFSSPPVTPGTSPSQVQVSANKALSPYTATRHTARQDPGLPHTSVQALRATMTQSLTNLDSTAAYTVASSHINRLSLALMGQLALGNDNGKLQWRRTTLAGQGWDRVGHRQALTR